MTTQQKPAVYRECIDSLVAACRAGQGQIGAKRVRAGVWNATATESVLPEQYRVNRLLSRLSSAERETLAILLVEQVELGVFETLKTLETLALAPFDSGYEGSPYNDFIGRLNGWPWPEGSAEVNEHEGAVFSFAVAGDPASLVATLFQARDDETLFGLTATAAAAPSALVEWTRFRDYLMEGFVFYDLRVRPSPTGITLEVRPNGGNRDKYLRSHLRWHLSQAKVAFEDAG